MSRNSLRFVSRLEAPAAAVWASISTMDGVNYELSPLFRMSFPKQAATLDIADAPLGQVAFQSLLLLFRVLPIDRHALTLIEVQRGTGFVEDSTSLMQRRWRHERRIEPIDETRCRITDDLTFEPRLSFMLPMVRGIVRILFHHRHDRLIEKFGGVRQE